LWRLYYQDTNGVIFVVDSSDKEKIYLVKEELHKHLEDPHLRATAILI